MESAGGGYRPKLSTQDFAAKYWGTWTPCGKKRMVTKTDGTQTTDKTAGFHSRPAKKESLRQANRAINKSARRLLKQQMEEELWET